MTSLRDAVIARDVTRDVLATGDRLDHYLHQLTARLAGNA